MISPFHHLPDRALLRTQEEQVPLSSSQLAARRFRDISWELAETTHGLDVSITAQETPLKELVLRWDLDFPQGCRFLGGPWELNRQWLQLLAESGTPLFTSIQPGVLTPEQEEEVRAAYAMASRHSSDGAYPLDWQNNMYPESWLLSHRKETFRWYLDR